MAILTFQQIADKTGRKLETVFQEVVMDLSEKVTDNTPLQTGFLKGSWFLGINTITGPSGNFDTTGVMAVATIALAAQGLRVGDVATIGNNASYAKYVEYGTRNMAPRAMVRKTIRDSQAIIARTTERVKKK